VGFEHSPITSTKITGKIIREIIREVRAEID